MITLLSPVGNSVWQSASQSYRSTPTSYPLTFDCQGENPFYFSNDASKIADTPTWRFHEKVVLMKKQRFASYL
jgi:hypothetical protein